MRKPTILMAMVVSGVSWGTPPWFESTPMQVFGISGDGTTIVGTLNGQAATWRRGTGAQRLPLPTGWGASKGWSASRDGRRVVGRSGVMTVNGVPTQHAFVWDEATGLRVLPDLQGGTEVGEAVGISDDGTVIVGSGRDGAHVFATRWTTPDYFVESLGTLATPFASSVGMGVSRDGATALVTAFFSGFVTSQAAIYTGGELVGLGDLPGGPEISSAIAISDDGRVVVGFGRRYNESSREEAFRWTAGQGMVGLGLLHPEPARSSAWGVNGDGDTIVGEAGPTGGALEAFVWTPGAGMRRLAELVAELGVDAHGAVLQRASVISSDGRTIAGLTPGGGFVLYVGSECPSDYDDGTGRGRADGGVGIEDLVYYLRVFSEGDVTADLDDGSMTGVRDRGVTIDDLVYFLTRFGAGC
jgi:probable HAF family extracellular repeat protein